MAKKCKPQNHSVYVVIESGGTYSDAYTTPIACFLSRKSADIFADTENKKQSRRRFINRLDYYVMEIKFIRD